MCFPNPTDLPSFCTGYKQWLVKLHQKTSDMQSTRELCTYTSRLEMDISFAKWFVCCQEILEFFSFWNQNEVKLCWTLLNLKKNTNFSHTVVGDRTLYMYLSLWFKGKFILQLSFFCLFGFRIIFFKSISLTNINQKLMWCQNNISKEVITLDTPVESAKYDGDTLSSTFATSLGRFLQGNSWVFWTW